MTSRSRPRIFRAGRAVRETVWLGLDTSVATITAASSAVLLNSLNAAALALRPFTVIRSRGYLTIESDQSAASEFYHVAYGLAIVSDQATAIGVTAVPTPETDRGSDLFFMYEELAGIFEFGDATGFQSPALATHRFDSKAMRKVDVGQDLIFVAETSTQSNGCVIRQAGRVLVKLH